MFPLPSSYGSAIEDAIYADLERQRREREGYGAPMAPMEPQSAQEPPGWLSRFAGRLPNYGFAGLPQEAYTNALRTGLFHAGASMIGRSEGPLELLGEGLRTGIEAHRLSVADEAESEGRRRSGEAHGREIERQREAVISLPANVQGRIAPLVGTEGFWDAYEKASTPQKRDTTNVDGKVVDTQTGDVIYEGEEEDEYKVVGGRLVQINADGGPQVVIDAVPKTDKPWDTEVDGKLLRIQPDGTVETLYESEPKPEDEFSSAKESWIGRNAEAQYELAVDSYKRRRSSEIGALNEEERAAWEAANPPPMFDDYLRQAATKAEAMWGYRSAHLGPVQPPAEAEPEDAPLRDQPAAPGGPADRIRNKTLFDLKAEAASWKPGWGSEWAAQQYQAAIDAGATPEQAAQAVRDFYERNANR